MFQSWLTKQSKAAVETYCTSLCQIDLSVADITQIAKAVEDAGAKLINHDYHLSRYAIWT